MTGVSELVEWLRAQLDEDAEGFEALGEVNLNGIESTASDWAREYVERARAEVDAKRRVLDLHGVVWRRSTGGVADRVADCRVCDHFPAQYPCPTLRLLALPYADRPGYRDEWRPSD
jgi:hypothetical protein